MTIMRQFVESGNGSGVIPELTAQSLAGNPALEAIPLDAKREV